jgi:hypothetical protein
MPGSLRSALCALSTLTLVSSASAETPTSTAEYTVTFESSWSAQTHPVDYPSNSHFSGLIGTTHDASVSFWEVGQLASPGIESMAETGSKSPLLGEIAAAVTAGGADALISGGGINPSPGSVSVSFQADLNYPLVSLVSMIAPSPDWFVGVSGMSLLDNGDWVAEKVVTLWPFDSGTDNGTTYASFDSDTNPAEPIYQIMTLPVGNGVPLGTFTFTRTDVPTAVDPDEGTTGSRTRAVLYQNSPNPFNPSTTIRYHLPSAQNVRVAVYDAVGRELLTLVDRVQDAGTHDVRWNGRDRAGRQVVSGVYFYQLRAGSLVERKRMVLLK